MKQGFAQKVRTAGGEIYAISSEPQALAGRAATDWHLNFATLGDPHHEISGACRERGWIDLFVNERLEFLRASTGYAVGWAPTHPKGYYQPGVLAVERDRVLYRWRSVPTRKNVGGAIERPTAEHVWAKIAAALDGGPAAADAPLDTEPALDSVQIPWPIFASLLIANGWFVNARGFKSTRRVGLAALRLVAFAAAWTAAFAWLPVIPVALALAGWVAFITPKVRWVSREFQNVRAA